MAVYNHQISEEQVAAFRVQLVDLVEKSRMYAEETISRDAVSRLMLLNRTYFSTLLQLATGKSFRAYINDLRMQYVLELMADPTMSLNDIPCMVGYKNKTTYYRVFDQAFGCLPRVYRLAHFPEACAAMSETAAAMSNNGAAMSNNDATMSNNSATMSNNSAAMSKNCATMSNNDATMSNNGAAILKNGAKTSDADSAVSLTDSLTTAE